MFAPPRGEAGAGMTGVLVVVETGNHRCRLCAPVFAYDSPGAVFRGALVNPEPGTEPGRPMEVRVADDGLLEELASVLREASVPASVSQSLPSIVAYLAEAMAAAGGPQAPGLSEPLAAWRTVLNEFANMAPWKQVANNLCFRFSGGALDGRLAIIIGNAGEDRGLILFATESAYKANVSRVPGTGLSGISFITVKMEPSGELTPAERAACLRERLVFGGGLHAKAYTAHESVFRAPNAEEQRVLLLAVQAVVAICRMHMAAIAKGEYRRLPFAGNGESIVVEAGIAS